MSRVLFLLYLIVEIIAFIAVGQWIGFGWALLALAGLFFVGVVIAAWETRRLTRRAMDDAVTAQEAARAHMSGEADDREGVEREARRALASAGTLVADSAMLMVGSVLLAVPGFVTSVLGLLLIVPPTRFLIRKLGGASLSSWFQRTGSKSMFVVQRYGVRFDDPDDNGMVIDHDDAGAGAGAPGPRGRGGANPAGGPAALGRGTGERITFDVPDDARDLDDWAREDAERRGMTIDEDPDEGRDAADGESGGDGSADGGADGGLDGGEGPEPRR